MIDILNQTMNAGSTKGLVFVKTCVVIALVSMPSIAKPAFISLDSTLYGQGALTYDADTGLEWLDPWIAAGSAGYPFRTYDDVRGELALGGDFEGFRFATSDEINTLLFSSAGFNPATAINGSYNLNDIYAADYLTSFFSTTYGLYGNEGDVYTKIIDAMYDSGDPDQPASVWFGVTKLGDDYSGGKLNFYTLSDLTSNSTPYGFWLVRDAGIPVPAPWGISLLFIICAAISSSSLRCCFRF
ncbi:MAG: hypothetical protein KAH34_08835 [Ketobacter sp.]|nr:hypothetical protein [Ketobacter sp.]